MRVVIALGGNALGDTPEKQKEMAALTAKQILPIIFGCILLFGAMTLMSAVYKFSQEVMGAKE